MIPIPSVSEIVQLLIDYRSNIDNYDIMKLTAFHLAATHGHSDVCEVLMRQGANCAALDNECNTPVHYAISKNCDVVVTLEMAKKCSLSLFHPNKHGITPLMTAIDSWKEESADLFPNLLAIARSDLPHNVWSKILNKRTDLGHTMLHYAVLEKKLTCVKVLLSIGALVDSRDNLGHTPLASAVKNKSREIIKLLLAAGATTRTLVCNDEIYADIEIDVEINDRLMEGTRQPSSLTNLCRIHYARRFGLSDHMEGKWLPKRFIDFLNYEVVDL